MGRKSASYAWENPAETKRCFAGDECLHPEGPVLPLTSVYWHNHRDSYSKENRPESRCKVCRCARVRKWRQDNPDYQHSWYEGNKDSERVKREDWMERNPDYYAAYSKTARGRFGVSAGSANESAKEWNVPGRLSIDDVERAFHESGGKCAICGMAITPFTGWLEHDMPFSRGGTNTPENITWTCATCNRRKFTRTIEEFRVWLQQKAAS